MKHFLFNNSQNNYEHLFIIKSFNKDTLLFSEGEICKEVCLVLEGEVKISTLTYNEKEYTINVIGKNSIFGEFLLFSNNNEYLGDIIVKENSKLAFINKSNLILLLKDPIILENYLKLLSNTSMNNQEKIKIFSQKNIEDRIMFYLLNESKKIHSKKIKIKSKENLALILNIPRPSLSRSLIKLKNNNLIDFDKYSITLKF